MIAKFAGLLILQIFLICLGCFSQTGILSGKITDARTGDPLAGVTISFGNNKGAVSDPEGRFALEMDSGNYFASISCIGYLPVRKAITISSGNSTSLDIQLTENASELNIVVVTASKYEKNITEETVSMEVLKPSFISNTNPISMDDAVKQVPGVTIIDNQANIRGGSGFSYGAGSRVLILVDDIPQLSADANDVKWEFLPVENINQVEVIKGASSVLYGSSALNGVINVRTNYPSATPQTHINAYHGYYLNPQRKEIIWWGNRQPNFGGGNFFHSRKINQLDLVIGGNLYSESSYHEGEYTQRGRISANTRYRFKKADGLSAGINANYMFYHSGTYFLWQDDSSGAYQVFGGTDTATTTVSEGKNTRFNIDPFVNYFTRNGDAHTFKMRYFYTRNNNNTGQGSSAAFYFGEYQYRKELSFNLNLIAGIMASYSDVTSELYSNHFANNFAGFIELDQKLGKLTIVAGLRYETFRVDTATGTSKPVFRAGINYPLTKSTFLRASFGQGYRFPSIAEKFVSTTVSVLRIFPNPEVQPESGWSTELGLKQAFEIRNWGGYADVAVFLQRYKDLIEFSFGYYDPDPVPGQYDLNFLGFKSINIDNARVTGTEFSIIGEGNIGRFRMNVLSGITFISPINLHQKDYVDSVLSNDNLLSDSQQDSLKKSEFLNYRFRWTAKVNSDISWKKFSAGLNVQYNSFMKNIDPFFEGNDPLLIYLFGQPTEFIPGVKEYREKHHHSDYVINVRLSAELTEKIRLSFIAKNLLNREYSTRPALLEAPLNIQAQVSMKF
ncbi:MAG: TonB-dependent receptor [Chitinophagales bacterium]